jgi:hypothetical protein
LLPARVYSAASFHSFLIASSLLSRFGKHHHPLPASRSESEQKLAAISALMSDFSSKVLTQSETIESVFATTQQSTMHLERGQNELKVPPPCDGVGFRMCHSGKFYRCERTLEAFVFKRLFVFTIFD